MKQTENFKLNIPERSDIYNLDAFNQNFIKLDNIIKQLQDQGVITTFTINSFTATPSSVTSGVATNVILKWSCSDDTIDSQTIDDIDITNTDRTYSTSVTITSAKTFTLKVVKDGVTYTKTVSVGIKTPMNRFYYGSSETPDTLTATDISAMSYKESSTNKIEVDVECVNNNYVIFAIPKTIADSFGSNLEKSVYMGSFAGGMVKLKDIDGINNTTYTIMRSEYAQSESTITISIK